MWVSPQPTFGTSILTSPRFGGDSRVDSQRCPCLPPAQPAPGMPYRTPGKETVSATDLTDVKTFPEQSQTFVRSRSVCRRFLSRLDHGPQLGDARARIVSLMSLVSPTPRPLRLARQPSVDISQSPTSRCASWRWALLFAAAGAMALGAQTYLLRELLVLLQGDEVAVGVGLFAWFLGIAFGSVATRRITHSSARSLSASALHLLALSAGCGVPLIRLGRSLLAAPSGELLTLGPSLLIAVACLAIPGCFVGILFVAFASLARAETGDTHKAITQLYLFEALGSLTAGLGTTSLLALSVGPIRGIALIATLSLLAAVPAAHRKIVPGKWGFLLVALLLAGFAFSPLSARLESSTERARFASLAPGQELSAAIHTPYQHLAISRNPPHVLYANGVLSASFPEPYSDEILAHQLMLLSAHPSRVLSLGGLETGLLRFCLMHPITRIDLVLIDESALRFTKQYLDPVDRDALEDPRVHVAFSDPHRFLTTTDLPYDLVLSLAPEPTTLYLARDTSVEFYRMIRAHLSPAGVFVSRFSVGANVQSGQLAKLGACRYRTLQEVFPVVRATPGPDAFLVAGLSDAHVRLDTSTLATRLGKRNIRSEVFVPELLPELLPAERLATIESELKRDAASVEAASNDRPIAFRDALSLRQRIAGSAWSGILRWAESNHYWLMTLTLSPSALLYLHQILRHRRPRRSVATWHAVTTSGLCGLAGNLLLVASFQTRVGALYSELGTLNGLFMVGLALGAGFAACHAPQLSLRRGQMVALMIFALLVAALSGMSHLIATTLALRLLHAVLLIGVGFATGLIIPAATAELIADPANRNSTALPAGLELCEHVGAAAAALFSAVLLIPILGLLQTSAVLLMLQALALLLTSTTCHRQPPA